MGQHATARRSGARQYRVNGRQWKDYRASDRHKQSPDTTEKRRLNNGDVYVSIIPFVKDVNVDPVNYNQNWIDWTDWDSNNGTCSRHRYTTKSSCTRAGKTWTAANHNTWNGCVSDRGNSTGPNTGNYDTNVVVPNTAVTATLLPAEQYSPCPQALMALSYNWSRMTTLVNNMSPGSNTNQAI